MDVVLQDKVKVMDTVVEPVVEAEVEDDIKIVNSNPGCSSHHEAWNRILNLSMASHFIGVPHTCVG